MNLVRSAEGRRGEKRRGGAIRRCGEEEIRDVSGGTERGGRREREGRNEA
jgi:hypothetical protein